MPNPLEELKHCFEYESSQNKIKYKITLFQ
jgi:hypothetical protein